MSSKVARSTNAGKAEETPPFTERMSVRVNAALKTASISTLMMIFAGVASEHQVVTRNLPQDAIREGHLVQQG